MATIRERKAQDGTTSYHVQVRLKGHPTETASFRRKTDAKKWAQATETAIRDGRHFQAHEAKKRTLAELIERYKREFLPAKRDAANQSRQLDWWKKHLGHSTLADVSPAVLADHKNKLATTKIRRGKTRSAATVNRYLAVLSHALSIAVREFQWLDDNPMRMVSKLKEPKGRVRFLSDDEREQLLKACAESSNPYLYPVVVLALSTGARYSEIMNLRWSDVDLRDGTAVLHETKNDERRQLPTKHLALDLLRDMSKIRRIDSELLFPRRDGRKAMNIRKPWLNALSAADIHDFRFHDLRHSAASYMAMNGSTPGEIAAVLGHKSLAMVKRYAHLSEAHTAGVVASMNEKIFSRPAS